jgi:hypothetical protein
MAFVVFGDVPEVVDVANNLLASFLTAFTAVQDVISDATNTMNKTANNNFSAISSS